MSWAHPLVIGLVPAELVAVWWILHRAGVGEVPFFANIKRRWADRHGLSDKAMQKTPRLLRGLFLAVGAAAALFALARPQWGEIAEQSYDQSREVMLALDLSRSMLADDVAPSRLARAKLLISALLDQLQGERVGLIVFSGTAFVQSPLSADYEVLRDFLDELEPSYLPQGGTDYESMLRTATQAFGQQGEGDRYLVVLSDGEALDQNWQALVPGLRERGIRVIGLGVGTPDGALVPDGEGGLIKDEQGSAVLSRLEPRTLQVLAAQTDGAYRDAAMWVDVAELVNATVEQGKRGNYVEQRNVRLQDRYQWFLFPALLCLLLSYCFDFPLSPLARALPTRGRRPHPASAPVIAAALLGLAAWQFPSLATAAVSDTSPPQSGTASQPNPLTATVAALSSQPNLAPTDYARLATDTIAFAGQPNAPTDASRAPIIDDALAAVDRGEAVDTHAADWPALRRQLEQLKQLPEPPPQDRQSEQQQKPQEPKDQQDQNQQGQSGQQDQQSGGAGGSPAADQNKAGAGQQTEDGKDDASQASQPGQKSESQKDRQSERKDSAQNADSQSADHQADNAQAAQQAGEPAKPGEEQQQAAAGEVQRKEDVQPLDAPEAGLGGQEEHEQKAGQEPKEAQAAAQPAAQEPAGEPPPSTRMVGGGRALQGAEPQGDSALAMALADMQRVQDGDAPAVLFDRMNRAEGQPRAPKSGKNW